ncbi:MAG: glycine-rich domain-containing protein [Rufibacter sp.]
MNEQEKLLWEKIQNFPLNEEIVALTFSQRLARENRWTPLFAERVIDEYRKFLFLCCISNTGVTPSDAVDQAWHLHLTYTRSYWIDFCRNTVGREIHHNPTKGGYTEGAKFDQYYTSTHDLYEVTFQELPPKDIWPGNDVRFSETEFQRINLKKFWVIRKPPLSAKDVFSLGFFTLAFLATALLPSEQKGLPIFATVFMGFIWLIALTRKGDLSFGGAGGSCGATTSLCNFQGDSDGGGDSSGCSSDGCSGCGGCGGD